MWVWPSLLLALLLALEHLWFVGMPLSQPQLRQHCCCFELLLL
jgi:hypothetical protein